MVPLTLSKHCLVLILSVTCVSCFERIPLTDRILHYDTLDYNVEVVRNSHERIKRSSPGTLSRLDRHVFLSFYALDRNFTLELWPNRDIFTNDAQFLVHTDEGIISSSYDPATFYKGRIVGDSFSIVRGHLKDGVFDGEVTTGSKEKYHIETADKYFKEGSEFHSVIYSQNDVLFHVEGKESGCAAKKELLNKLERLQATAKPIKQKPSIKSKDLLNTLTSQFRKKRNLQKRTKTVSGGRFCPVFIAGDHLFVSNIGGGNENSAISEIASIFSTVQEIFINADFDENGTPDEIFPVLVKTELFTSSSHNGLFESSNIDVSTYLDRWSQINHEDVCLALLLTYRDFDDGVLGLAWVAQPPGGSRGGVCEDRTSLSIGERSLNTAIVTYLNYGSRQPRGVVGITIAHEFGHNFGSSHDPEGSDECSPGGNNGNFIMYPRATDGNRANNDEFSPCSNAAIEQVLLTKTDCFTTSAAFCGNQITENDEECDCGSSDPDTCATVDPCCQPGECTLISGAQCSGQDKCCDSDTCEFRPANTVCSPETECGEQSVCSGSSADCPMQATKNRTCSNGTMFCENAECTGSVCLVLTPQREDCQCTAEDEQCHVCCMIDNDCTSTFTLASEGVLKTPGQYRESGRSCDNYQGYCSDDSTPICIGVDNEQTLNDLLDLFSLETLDSVLQWLKTYWWVPILVIVGIIIIILLLHFTYRKRKPIKKAARRASTTMRRASASAGSGQSDAAARARARARERAPADTNREKFQRLKKFFPTCDEDMLASVLNLCKTEEKTVRQLITLGFPMKKVPIPRL